MGSAVQMRQCRSHPFLNAGEPSAGAAKVAGNASTESLLTVEARQGEIPDGHTESLLSTKEDRDLTPAPTKFRDAGGIS